MKHEGSRQVGGYRSSSDQPPKAAVARSQPSKHNAEFHRALNQLRTALRVDDAQRITQLERRIDHIVSEWEPHP